MHTHPLPSPSRATSAHRWMECAGTHHVPVPQGSACLSQLHGCDANLTQHIARVRNAFQRVRSLRRSQFQFREMDWFTQSRCPPRPRSCFPGIVRTSMSGELDVTVALHPLSHACVYPRPALLETLEPPQCIHRHCCRDLRHAVFLILL
ncbi:hypothetical protein PSPO01_02527 [Paraphaeosphaeria sporulosa]